MTNIQESKLYHSNFEMLSLYCNSVSYIKLPDNKSLPNDIFSINQLTKIDEILYWLFSFSCLDFSNRLFHALLATNNKTIVIKSEISRIIILVRVSVSNI